MLEKDFFGMKLLVNSLKAIIQKPMKAAVLGHFEGSMSFMTSNQHHQYSNFNT